MKVNNDSSSLSKDSAKRNLRQWLPTLIIPSVNRRYHFLPVLLLLLMLFTNCDFNIYPTKLLDCQVTNFTNIWRLITFRSAFGCSSCYWTIIWAQLSKLQAGIFTATSQTKFIISGKRILALSFSYCLSYAFITL